MKQYKHQKNTIHSPARSDDNNHIVSDTRTKLNGDQVITSPLGFAISISQRNNTDTSAPIHHLLHSSLAQEWFDADTKAPARRPRMGKVAASRDHPWEAFMHDKELSKNQKAHLTKVVSNMAHTTPSESSFDIQDHY
jgi:hypothetical protein